MRKPLQRKPIRQEVCDDRHGRTRNRQGPGTQGRRASDHRPHPVDRQHRVARDAAPGHPAQSRRACPHHRYRHQRRAQHARRRRGLHRRRPRRRARQPAMRMADHRGHEGATCPLARGGHGELRRRSRGRRGGPQRLRSAGRAREDRRRLRRPAGGARSRGRGRRRRGLGAPRSRHQHQRRSGHSTPRRPARAATSKRPSATPKCSCSAPSGSSGSFRRSWNPARWWSTRPARRSPCGRPRRSRTSCGSCWR